MFKINSICLIIFLSLTLWTKAAFTQNSPIADANTVNTPEVQTYQNTTSAGSSLSQDYQHPYTILRLRIEKQENVKLTIVNEAGREVIKIVDKKFNPGSYEIKLDATELGSGVYFCKISTPSFSETKKLAPVK